ncbi:2Fe-2S iron-sulfur cluster-binding protein [Shewanella sp. UCD-KL12]|uniref:2Fe-2S iron-sulfur cluster-binding protein n=1 Tax=Shewanella sp. UCD-KL12 TaxID=1917163 RepID=UPI000970EB08|nr:2Fe-2S iron-sulfur cluster-binding protein [Shewanella sp. UCD-KL12]
MSSTIPVTFIEPDGSEKQVQAEIGLSLMVTAQDHQIEGIAALCNGCCSCGTCHIELETAVLNQIPGQYSGETQVLKNLTHVSSSSRLACQVIVTDKLANIRVRVKSS